MGKRTITYAELWGKNMNEARIAADLTEMAGQDHISAFYLSPDAWAKRSDANSVAQQIGDELAMMGSKVPYPIQASTDRIGGARSMYKMLRENEWVISDACEKLIDSTPQLIHGEPPKAEDVLKVDNGPGQLGDDAYDNARYGLYTHFEPGQRTKEAEIREKAATITDPIARWCYLHFNLPREEDNAPFRINYKMRWEQ